MTTNPILLLTANASLQVLASSLLGALMLIPFQPWGAAFKRRVNLKALLSAHLDWLMLAFMQWGAASTMEHLPNTASQTAAWLLVFGGWSNATPYLFRAFGVDAFSLSGSLLQRAAASFGALSSLAIIVAWAHIGLDVMF
jgi:hypothetical protein